MSECIHGTPLYQDCHQCQPIPDCQPDVPRHEYDDMAAEVLRLRAEVERLRGTLEDIADGMGETKRSSIGRFAPDVARAALKEKEA